MDIANQAPPLRRKIDILYLLPFIVFAGLLATLYTNALHWWYFEWTAQSTYYQHGVFIPFFVAIMIWRDRERLRRLPLSRSWWGLPLIFLAIGLVLFAIRAEVTLTLSISFILFLIGATLLVAGPKVTRALLFPMLFLFTMIPIVPNMIINYVAFPIQVLSAKLAATLLNIAHFPTDRIGVELHMESYTLNVELPCSGFKTLVGLLSFSGAFAYLVEGPVRKRWILFLSSAPLAVLVNGVRIALIGLVGEIFSADAAHSFHDYSGFIVLICGFMFLFWFAKTLKCDSFLGMSLADPPPPPPPGPDAPAENAASRREIEQAARKQAIQKLNAELGPPRPGALRHAATGIYPLIAIVAIACVAVRFVKVPTAEYKMLESADLPATIGGGAWKQLGGDVPIDPQTRETLNPTAWIDRTYFATGPVSASMNLLISGGNSRRVFHDPHECFLGSGFLLHDVGVTTIQTPSGPIAVQETVAEVVKTHEKSLMMFVYVVEGEQTQSALRVHAKMMWGTLFGESRRPSYFLRFRQMGNGTEPAKREELMDFIKAVWTEAGPKISHPQMLQRTARDARMKDEG